MRSLRAWHKKYKQYFKIKEIKFNIYPNVDYFFLYNDSFERCDAYTDDIILEESSGRLDYVEREIFDGDLVIDEDEVYEVYNNKEDARFELILDDNVTFSLGDMDTSSMRIFGNIHERKE